MCAVWRVKPYDVSFFQCAKYITYCFVAAVTDDCLRFHRRHGQHIKLSDERSQASLSTPVSPGYCFSHRSIAINERVKVQCVKGKLFSLEHFGIGFTSHDPDTLDPDTLPDTNEINQKP